MGIWSEGGHIFKLLSLVKLSVISQLNSCLFLVKFISLREEPVIGLDDGHVKVKDSQKKVKIPKVF